MKILQVLVIIQVFFWKSNADLTSYIEDLINENNNQTNKPLKGFDENKNKIDIEIINFVQSKFD